MKKIFKLLPQALLLILMVYVLAMKISPENVKKYIGYQPFVILTDSMEPVIPTGSAVLVKNLKDNEEPKEGDIISFNVDRLGEAAVFTHYFRGTEKQEDGTTRYLTQGATAERVDDYITHREDIIGTYVFHIPYVGRFVLFLQSPFALIELGIIMFITIIYNLLWDKFDKEEKEAARLLEEADSQDITEDSNGSEHQADVVSQDSEAQNSGNQSSGIQEVVTQDSESIKKETENEAPQDTAKVQEPADPTKCDSEEVPPSDSESVTPTSTQSTHMLPDTTCSN